MADFRLSANIIGRSSGRSSVAAAAYRAGAQMTDERTGEVHDFTRKGGVLHSEILAPETAPDWMKDRAQLWNAVEVAERRKDAQLAREIQLSLPHELDEAQNRSLLMGFIQSRFVDQGMIADVAIHAPDKAGDQRNVHAHVMLTTRVLTADGFGKKNRAWNTPEQLLEWRKSWADYQNQVFQELGMEQRVDHRSYADQGVDREPMQHLGPVANDMEKKGKASRIGDENRVRQDRNAQRAALAQEASKTSRLLAEEKARQDEQVNAQRAAMQSHLMQDQLEVSRRQVVQTSNLDADLERRNGEARRQFEADQRRLEAELAAEGWRKLMRDLLGKTRRDAERLEVTRLNLESLKAREAEERQALQARQEAERMQQAQAQQQRDAAYAQRLEAERQTALEKARDAARPTNEPKPANDRVEAPQRPSHAPEQDNEAPGRQDFQRAASGAPEASPAVPQKTQAVNELAERLRKTREAQQIDHRRGPEK